MALCISLGLSACACGRQDKASSAAALTILGSLPLEDLSAILAASGGVRWPSQLSMRNHMAGAPISIA